MLRLYALRKPDPPQRQEERKNEERERNEVYKRDGLKNLRHWEVGGNVDRLLTSNIFFLVLSK